MDNKIQTMEELKDYLDGAIKRWRQYRDEAIDERDDLISACYVDAFQSVRMSVFGELLPREDE